MIKIRIEDKILTLIRYAQPKDPIKYVCNIAKDYALERLYEDIYYCKCCDISKFNIKMHGTGNIHSDILILTEPLNKNDYMYAKKFDIDLMEPLSPAYMKMMNNYLKLINANKDYPYYAPSFCCCAADYCNNKINFRLPNQNELNNCKNNFISNFIEIIKPNVIVTLGASAGAMLGISNKPITQYRGLLYHHNGYAVVPTYSPQYINNNIEKEMKEVYAKDFLTDLYNAFSYAKTLNPSCGIGDVKLNISF